MNYGTEVLVLTAALCCLLFLGTLRSTANEIIGLDHLLGLPETQVGSRISIQLESMHMYYSVISKTIYTHLSFLVLSVLLPTLSVNYLPSSESSATPIVMPPLLIRRSKSLLVLCRELFSLPSTSYELKKLWGYR